jgi:hypothetical protein
MTAMTESVHLRSILTVFAAHVIALQALLLPLSVAGALATGSGLCLSAASSRGGQPAHNQSGCVCGMGCGVQCCAQATLTPPQVDLARPVARQIELSQTHFDVPLFTPSNFGPHHPRCPPVA